MAQPLQMPQFVSANGGTEADELSRRGRKRVGVDQCRVIGVQVYYRIYQVFLPMSR